MDRASKVFGSFECALDERFVDDHLRSDVRQFTSLPSLHLLAHRLEVALHSVDANRDTVDEREGLRVFREHRGKHAWDKVAKPTENMLAREGVEPPTPAFSGLRTTVLSPLFFSNETLQSGPSFVTIL